MKYNITTEITAMQAWCRENYSNGADTMVECWGVADYADLFDEGEETPAQAWSTLQSLAAIYQDRQSDAVNSAF